MPQRMKKSVTKRMKKKKLIYNWVPFAVLKSILKKTSLRRWKEQLLGSVDVNAVEETLEPDAKIWSLTILCPGRSIFF
ncbi:Rho GDP-dissociation inhibitor 1 [Camellia lanceoleosa]|uniref:Rho GDP-dissociation inhibitor 1 n=1 Tax=Camellia lanceoleosa TaxID=1840588 RepID=A0ACC0HB62_9ERIC|nr:Rho GDP-dissociation inhibitor 1 [Camellia lanceoleosa]